MVGACADRIIEFKSTTLDAEGPIDFTHCKHWPPSCLPQKSTTKHSRDIRADCMGCDGHDEASGSRRSAPREASGGPRGPSWTTLCWFVTHSCGCARTAT